MRTIDYAATTKKIRLKGNSKPWFDSKRKKRKENTECYTERKGFI